MTNTPNFGGVLPALTDRKGDTIVNLAAFLARIDAHAAHCDRAFMMKEIDTPSSPPVTGYNALYFKGDDKLLNQARVYCGQRRS